MKSLFKVTLLTSAMVFALTACKEEAKTPAATVTAAAQTLSATSPSIDRESYAVGVSFGKEIKNMLETQGGGFKQAIIQQGFNDAFGGKTQLTEEELEQLMSALQVRMTQEMQAKQEQQIKEEKEAMQKAQVDGDKFRAEFEKKEGVKKTASGLLYRIETVGEGPVIKDGDTVVVHYKGTFIDGKEFDSSYARKEPATIPLDMVIPGWREGIELLKKGGKIQLVIPPELGYGDSSLAGIPGNSTLVFDVELLDINPPPVAANKAVDTK